MADVSRETPPPPREAAGVFASRLPLAESFCELLATDGVVRGLIGPREAPRLWERHLLNCAVIAPAFEEGSAVADVGSGAGLPGLVLAIVRPDLQVTLIEPLLRRTSFLLECVEALGLSNVEVLRGRAEEFHGSREFDVVTARAVAPLDRLAKWCLPLSREGGSLLAMKGESATDELRESEDGLRSLGATRISLERYGEGIVDPQTVVVRVEAGPRRPIGWGGNNSGEKRRSRRPRK